MSNPSRKATPIRIVAFVAAIITLVICCGFAYISTR